MAKGILPNYLEEEKREYFMLNYITVTRKICGKLGTGRRPYITFEGAEYRSEVLSKAFPLVGRTLTLRFNPDDIRTCKAFFEDGTEFCDLCVIGQWRNQPHSLDQRRAANRLLNEKKLKDNNFIDPMQSYDKYLIEESKKSKRARNKLAGRQITQKLDNDNIPSTQNDLFETKSQNQIKETTFSQDELEERFKYNNKNSYN